VSPLLEAIMNGTGRSNGGLPNGLELFGTILASTLLLASTFPSGKLLLLHHTPPFMLAGFRFLLAPLSILAVTTVLGDSGRAILRPSLKLRDAVTIAVIGLLQTAVCIGCLFLAMQRISPSAAALLLFTNPIWVAGLGVVVLRQPLTAGRVLGLVLGIVGVALILTPTSGGKFDAIGYAFGLLSSFGWAGATLVTKKVKPPVSPWALTFWQMVCGALALLCLSFFVGEKWSDANPFSSDALVFVWLAIPGSAGAYGLWSIALSKAKDAGEVSSFLFLVPFFATILSYVLLGSILSLSQLFGGVAICLGLWISTRWTMTTVSPLLKTSS
jgi:drug/metabolite transporter (DMT)-like permease